MTPPSKKQKQQHSDDIQQQIPHHAGLEDQVPDQILQPITDEEPQNQQGNDDLGDFVCLEEDFQKAIREDGQVEVKGDHLNNIQIYIRNQLPALSVTSVDADVRASIIDAMLSSVDAASYPLAAHLAVQLFDRYFATFSQVEAVNALNPRKVASDALRVAIEYLYPEQVHLQNQVAPFQLLNAIQYRLNTPTTKKLVDAVLACTGPHASHLASVCSYVLELGLLDRDCSGFQIDVLAAACLFLGQFVLDSANPPKVRAPWECDAQRLREAVAILHELFLGSRLPHCRSVRTKYSSMEFEEVATLPCPAAIPDNYF